MRITNEDMWAFAIILFMIVYVGLLIWLGNGGAWCGDFMGCKMQ